MCFSLGDEKACKGGAKNYVLVAQAIEHAAARTGFGAALELPFMRTPFLTNYFTFAQAECECVDVNVLGCMVCYLLVIGKSLLGKARQSIPIHAAARSTFMRAAVFHHPKKIICDDWPDPKIEDPRDAIVRVTTTAICGSDLHIYNGLLPQVKDMVMGHEFMGIVEEVGPEVHNLKKGDRVVVPFPIGCGRCWFCENMLTTHCENSNADNYGPGGGIMKEKGGGIFGYTHLYGVYSGGQAEAVRVPYADFGPRKVPEGLTDEQVLFLTDIFPTGWTGVKWGEPQGGETVAVFGSGPVGIMAMKSAWGQGAARVIGVDVLDYRLDKAKNTANAEVINAKKDKPIDVIRDMTDGRGADIVIDCVGMEADRGFLDMVNAAVHLQRGSDAVLEDCMTAVRRGGHVVVIGVCGTTYDNFPVSQFFDKGIILRGGQALVHKYIDECMELVASGRVKLDDIITHRLSLEDVDKGYSMFNEKKDDCVKIVMKP